MHSPCSATALSPQPATLRAKSPANRLQGWASLLAWRWYQAHSTIMFCRSGNSSPYDLPEATTACMHPLCECVCACARVVRPPRSWTLRRVYSSSLTWSCSRPWMGTHVPWCWQPSEWRCVPLTLQLSRKPMVSLAQPCGRTCLWCCAGPPQRG